MNKAQSCTFEQAALNNVRDGLQASVQQRWDWLCESMDLAVANARRRAQRGQVTLDSNLRIWWSPELEQACGLNAAVAKPTMIKLTKFEHVDTKRLLLRFSDGSWGIFDFTPLITANTDMTASLGDPVFFQRCFIELGALAWPNGFDLGADSLHRWLVERGELKRDVARIGWGKRSEPQHR